MEKFYKQEKMFNIKRYMPQLRPTALAINLSYDKFDEKFKLHTVCLVEASNL